MTTRAQRAAKTICHTLGTTGRHHAPVAEIIQREFQQQADALASAKAALMVATTPLPEDRQKVLAAIAKINAL